MEERSFHPLDYVAVLRRRKWWFIVPLVLCLAGGAALVMVLPKEYKSVAEIGIAAPTLSPELLRGVSSLDTEERRRAISQQLLSPIVLERVVREEHINPNAPVSDTAAWLRGKVEKNIDVPKPIGRADDPKALDRIRLGYVDSEPERAQRITNRLASVFVEENSKLRTERAENTAAVLEQQMRASQQRLAALQEQLRRQKEANIGRLPTQENANLQMVNGLNSRIETTSMQLNMEQNRLSMLDQQLEEMRRSAPSVPTSPGASPLAAEMFAAQTRITSLATELAQNRALGYTDEHPEIRRITRELAGARAELNAAKQPGAAGPSRDEFLKGDTLYVQRTVERQLAQNRVRELQRSLRAANAQIAMYQSRLESAPMVEQALASLTQEHDLEKKRYEELSGKYQGAIMAEDLAKKQGGERFSVLYPASLPRSPESPDVLKILLMSLALGLALGAGMVVGREFLDRSVHDARALQSEFEVPVLGEIPRIQKAA
jgi:polysaccharide chain length determinant protein (PEP-CTERM system associated)